MIYKNSTAMSNVLQKIEELESARDEIQQQPDLVAGKLRDLEVVRQRQRSTGEAISSSRARTPHPPWPRSTGVALLAPLLCLRSCMPTCSAHRCIGACGLKMRLRSTSPAHWRNNHAQLFAGGVHVLADSISRDGEAGEEGAAGHGGDRARAAGPEEAHRTPAPGRQAGRGRARQPVRPCYSPYAHHACALSTRYAANCEIGPGRLFGTL